MAHQSLPAGGNHMTSAVERLEGRVLWCMTPADALHPGHVMLAPFEVAAVTAAPGRAGGVVPWAVPMVAPADAVAPPPPGGEPTPDPQVGVAAGSWVRGANVPAAMGEVAGGVIGSRLYLVGGGNRGTFAYDLQTGRWVSGLAQRPVIGDHHAAEVVNGRLYILGGLNGLGGKVQIYNPATNRWTLGRDMPFAAGSSSSAVIGGQIYVAGGSIGQTGTRRLARYNPATNTWTELAPMPFDRNHTASGTDGRRLYIFGGRDGGNRLANGYNDVLIYDPATNRWTTSRADRTIPPLPQARGGMGKAAFVNGEFYVMGGETVNGAGATANGVYSRVDIYNPTTRRWRLGAPMPTARHGIFPLLASGRIYVAAGGVRAAASVSNILEIYRPG